MIPLLFWIIVLTELIQAFGLQAGVIFVLSTAMFFIVTDKKEEI